MAHRRIPLDPRWFEPIRTGRKTSTIRRNITCEVGTYLRFEASSGSPQQAMVVVEDVSRIAFSELTNEHARTEFVGSVEELQALLREYYPDIEPDDELTVVEFTYLPPDSEINVEYSSLPTDQEQFDNALAEMQRDLGWASWTRDLTAVWNELDDLTAETLDGHCNVYIQQSNLNDQTATFAIPSSLIDWSYNGIPALLSLVAGDVIGSSGVGNVQVRRINLPDPVRRQFFGPKMGISGVRRLCGVEERPIVAFSVKPRVGMTTGQFARVAQAAGEGGIDIVEDDERQSNQSMSRVLDRAEAAIEALEDLDAVYSANITGRADRMVSLAESLVARGVRMLKIDVLPSGFAALQAVSEWIHDQDHDVAITVYPAMNKLYERTVPRRFLLELCRLCGADVVYAGIPELHREGRTQDAVRFREAAELHQLLKTERAFHHPVLPTVSTAITPLNIGAYSELAGPNVGFFVGAGVSAYTGELREAVELLMRACRNPTQGEDIFETDELERLVGSGFGEDVLQIEEDQRTLREAFVGARRL